MMLLLMMMIMSLKRDLAKRLNYLAQHSDSIVFLGKRRRMNFCKLSESKRIQFATAATTSLDALAMSKRSHKSANQCHTLRVLNSICFKAPYTNLFMFQIMSCCIVQTLMRIAITFVAWRAHHCSWRLCCANRFATRLARDFPPRVFNHNTATRAVVFTCSRAPCYHSFVWYSSSGPRPEQSRGGEQLALQDARKFHKHLLMLLSVLFLWVWT